MVVSHLEAFPRGARLPVRQLLPRDEGVAIGREVDTQHATVHVPRHEDSHSGSAHVESHQHPAEEDPAGDEGLVAAPRGLL